MRRRRRRRSQRWSSPATGDPLASVGAAAADGSSARASALARPLRPRCSTASGSGVTARTRACSCSCGPGARLTWRARCRWWRVQPAALWAPWGRPASRPPAA
eukprot:7707243-Pyramimonas_sp.AAC.1